MESGGRGQPNSCSPRRVFDLSLVQRRRRLRGGGSIWQFRTSEFERPSDQIHINEIESRVLSWDPEAGGIYDSNQFSPAHRRTSSQWGAGSAGIRTDRCCLPRSLCPPPPVYLVALGPSTSDRYFRRS